MALRKDNDRMKGFVDKINKTEPKKTYGFNPPITAPKTNLDLKEAEKRTQISRIQGQGTKTNFDPSKGHALSMVAAPHEYLLGPGPVKAGGAAVKAGFNLSKNIITKGPSVTKQLATKGLNYLKKQGEKIAADIGIGVAADKISKKIKEH